jgi:cellulose synthase (UDP-forming)
MAAPLALLHRGQGRHRSIASVLPDPPSGNERISYLQRNVPYLAICLMVASGFAVACQVGFEIFDSPWLFPVTILAVAHAVISSSVNFSGPSFDYNAHMERVRSWQPASYPDADIYLPICGEPIDVLRNTWAGIFELIQAYAGWAAAYVLDDRPSAEASQLAADFGFTYVVRPDVGRMRKAGNLRHAFARTRGEFIVIFDADFTPQWDFLAETLPYFEDPSVGILQTPQFFRTNRGQTWVERAGNAVQEIFYRNIQVARDYFGTTVCCGTCAVYRRAALAPDGGFAEVPYAEDEHTGLNVREHGYSVRYIPVALAAGMSPTTIDGFVRQQYRWCSGTFSTLRRWPKHGIRARLTYASGFFYYLYSSSMLFAGPALPLALLIFFPENVRLQNFLIFAPVLLSGMVLYPAWHRCDYGPSVWPLAVARSWSHCLAICDYARGKTMQWQPTGSGSSPVRRLWVGIYIWNGGSALAWLALACWRIAEYGSAQFAILLALGLLYVGIVLRVIFPGESV